MAHRSRNLRRLVADLESYGPAAAEEITARIKELDEVRVMEDPTFLQLVHESSLANVAAGMRILSQGERLPRTAPADVGEAARAAARAGISVATVLRAYRIAHAVCWRYWMAGTERLELSAAERKALLEDGSEFLFEFVDHISTLVTEAYTREREGLIRSIEQRRIRLVKDVVDGVLSDGTELDYDLGLDHLAVVAWGGEAESTIRALGQEIDRRVLSVPAGGDVVWGWLGGLSPLEDAGKNALRRFDPRAATSVALGDPAPGVGGFRESHRDALDAQRVGLKTGSRVTHYDDVALEVLAIRDERYARAFVERELAPLSGSDERAQRLRETLRAYFASGQNAAAAAAMLGVHDQTVSYRLRTIEESLGRPVYTRRAELETALRLEAFMDSPAAETGRSPSDLAPRPEISA